MAVTRLKRKARKNKMKSKLRKQSIKIATDISIKKPVLREEEKVEDKKDATPSKEEKSAE
ncbi:MAG: hypothetical protein ACJATA_001104 [Sphingobacteriales bacterium]|jgi:hypothetical protein